MSIAMPALLGMFSDFVWNLLRVAGFFMVVPIFGNQLVPARVRILLSAGVALALTPVLGDHPDVSNWDIGMLMTLAGQMLVGIGLGFATIIFFQLFVIAGQFVGMQMGLGFASMVDPGNGVQVTVWSQFFLMLVTLSFLALNGHLVLLQVLVEGYKAYPIGASMDLSTFAFDIAGLGGWMFLGGVIIAIPAIASLLIVNLAFGVMNRSAPQLNVFSLGFPFSLLFGLVVIWFLLFSWADQFPALVEEFFEIFSQLQRSVYSPA